MPRNVYTVIIPTLNEEVCLPKLLSNLTRQTNQDFKVIIVDGNSNDRTKIKAESFNSKLNLIIYTVNMRSASYQRNFGANKADDGVLIFMDADITIPSSFIRKIKETFKSKNPSLLTTYIKTDEKGVKPIETGTNLIFELSKLINSPALYGSMLAVKKSIFVKVGGFNEKMKYKEDTELARKIYKKGYKYVILKNTYYEWSLRRFRKLGTVKTLQKYFLLNLNKTLDYQMGGHLFVEKTIQKLQKTRTKELEIKVNNFVEKIIENLKIK